MAGSTIFGAAWVKENFHRILLARFQARDKLWDDIGQDTAKRQSSHACRDWGCEEKVKKGKRVTTLKGRHFNLVTL